MAEKAAENFEYDETVAKNYTYYSSKFSLIDEMNENETSDFLKSLTDNARKESKYFENLSLYRDTHFYNISVNTTHSSVHVPTNVYHRAPAVLQTMMWSEGKFIQNEFPLPSLGADHQIVFLSPRSSVPAKLSV